MKLQKFFSLFAVLVLASACSSTDEQKADGAATGGYGDQSGMMTDENGVGSGALGDVVPGSREEFVALVGDRVFFGYDSSALSSEAQATLKRQAEWLVKNSDKNVVVEGHCDERGTREYNLALGERRAAAVRDFLTRSGVAANRVTVISYGKEYPEYPGATEAAWSKNRRGVSVIQ